MRYFKESDLLDSMVKEKGLTISMKLRSDFIPKGSEGCGDQPDDGL